MSSNVPKPPSKSSVIPRAPAKTTYKKVLVDAVGQVPPSAIEMEEAVLGALLVDSKAIEQVNELLSPEVFFKEENRVVFNAIQSVHKDKTPVDLLTVSERLKRQGKLASVGGDFYLIGLLQKMFSSAHIDHHARVILQKYILRELINNSRSILHEAYLSDPDVFRLMDSIKNTLDRIQKKAIETSEIVNELDPIEELNRKIENVKKGISAGIPFGISEFDQWCGGVQPRDLITIAARPGMGKTTCALAVAGNLSVNLEQECAFFSLEMSRIDLIYRLSARLTNVSFDKIRNGKFDSSKEELKVKDAIQFLMNKSKLHIFDSVQHKNYYERIEAKVRELASKGVKLFVIDYVQLIKLLRATSNRVDDISTITRQLKGLCNELNITIVILAQVGRQTDSGQGQKRPILSHLKGSGSIEEDSDMVIFIYREAYYKEAENSTVILPPHVRCDTDFIVAKGRNTGTRTFRTYLNFSTYEIDSYSDVI